MYAGQAHLDNLCVIVDHNHGQLDLANRMVFNMPHLETVFESFGWEAVGVDATQYDGIYRALEHFRYRPRNGRPIGAHGMSTVDDTGGIDIPSGGSAFSLGREGADGTFRRQASWFRNWVSADGSTPYPAEPVGSG